MIALFYVKTRGYRDIFTAGLYQIYDSTLKAPGFSAETGGFMESDRLINRRLATDADVAESRLFKHLLVEVIASVNHDGVGH